MKLGGRAHTQHAQRPDFMEKAHKKAWEQTAGGEGDWDRALWEMNRDS